MNGWEAAVEIVQSWPIWISIWLGIAIWKRPAIERLVEKLRLGEREVQVGSVRFGPLTDSEELSAEARVAEKVAPDALDEALDTLRAANERAAASEYVGGASLAPSEIELKPLRLASQALETLGYLRNEEYVTIEFRPEEGQSAIYRATLEAGASALLVLSSDPAWADEPLESFTEAWLGLDDAGGRAAAFGRRTPFGQAMLNTWRELNSHHPESVVVMRSPTDLDIVAARELGWI